MNKIPPHLLNLVYGELDRVGEEDPGDALVEGRRRQGAQVRVVASVLDIKCYYHR